MAKKKATFRSTSRRLALEPRLLFDGAAAIAGAAALADDDLVATGLFHLEFPLGEVLGIGPEAEAIFLRLGFVAHGL